MHNIKCKIERTGWNIVFGYLASSLACKWIPVSWDDAQCSQVIFLGNCL